MNKVNYISVAKKASAIQISELKKINKTFNKSFTQAIDLMANCKGKVICAGIGKSGLIARKVAATFRAINPLLPIPAVMTFPLQLAINSTASTNDLSKTLLIFLSSEI
jgi:DNA-binding MurR/RpiR family transcriptional regulator